MVTAAPRHRLRVGAVTQETHDAISLHLDVPPELQAAFRYRPGQFLTLHLPLAGRSVPRCYSMSSSPGLDEGLRITIKRVPKGRGSNWVCDHVRAGDSLEVLAPAGVFSPKDLRAGLLLFAGGSGITPMMSILRAALAAGSPRIAIFYANRDERSVIFRDALRALAAEHPARLQVLHWLDAVQGVPSEAQLAAWARLHQATVAEALVCGPGPFMTAAVAALTAVGFDDEVVRVERFVSLPDEPLGTPQPHGAVASAPERPAVPAVAQARVALRLDGVVHDLAWPGGLTLLEVALQAGLQAPYSCQAGLCASCRCKVVEGAVHLRHNESLDDRDLSRGWTLACQAVPASEQLRIHFPE